MPLLKQVLAPNQLVLGYHRITRIEADLSGNSGFLMATIGSWVDEAAAATLTGKAPAWTTYVPIALSDVVTDLTTLIDTALAGTGDFAGATVIGDNILSLDGAKARRIAYILDQARRLDKEPITLQGYVFLTDDATRTLMYRKLTLAREAAADGQTFSVEWELDGGTTVTLNATQLKAVVRAIDARTEQLKATARGLRATILAATTIAEVEAVTWP
jgi:hypothetical protein